MKLTIMTNKIYLKSNVNLLAICLLFLTSCSTEAPKNNAGAPVAVNIYKVQLQDALYNDDYPGNVMALSQVDLRAEVEGYITGINFTEGQQVHKGQLLYEIDKRKFQANYEQAAANVKVAQANLEQLQKDADRYEYLNQHDAVAKQTLDHALTSLQNAKSQLNAAKQDMIKTQTDLKFSSITAPFDGTIGLSQVKLGALVIPGQTILNTISTNNPMAVDFVINEKQVSKFLALQKNTSSDTLFTILTPDNLPYPIPGKISVIDRGVDPQTGTIKIRLNFPNPEGDLRAGMSCRVLVHNTDVKNQIIIPAKAIVEQMGENYVFVTKDTTIAAGAQQDAKTPVPHFKVKQKKVQLGQTFNGKVIVKAGLEAGEQVVIEGVQKLRDNSLILVSEKPIGTNNTH